MKVFIVFLGLLMINLSFVCYQNDMAYYQQLQKELKAVAEECAAGAALYYDEAAYGQGLLVVKDQDAAAYAQYLVDRAQERMKRSVRPAMQGQGNIDWTLHILDEKVEGQYRSFHNGHWKIKPISELPDSVRRSRGTWSTVYEPSVVMDLTLHTGDLFRLPFLNVLRVERSAMYELSGNHSMG